MGTKNEPGAFDCYGSAEPDEMMFVLLARDRLGGALVRVWAATREAMGEDAAKVAEARACAQAMDAQCKAFGKEPMSIAEIMGIVARHADVRNGRRCISSTCPHNKDASGRAMCSMQLCPNTPIGGRVRV